MSNLQFKGGFSYQPNSGSKIELNIENEINRNNAWEVTAIALLQVWLVYKTNRDKENKVVK